MSPPTDMREVLVFPETREVAGDPPRLEVDALVPDPAPGAGVLAFETRAVNFRNNPVSINGTALGHLQGPGHGKASQDYFEELEVPDGVLRSGVNRVLFEAGADVSGAGVGARHDTFRVGALRLYYRPADAGGAGPSAPTALAGGALVLAALVWAWWRRRKEPDPGVPKVPPDTHAL